MSWKNHIFVSKKCSTDLSNLQYSKVYNNKVDKPIVLGNCFTFNYHETTIGCIAFSSSEDMTESFKMNENVHIEYGITHLFIASQKRAKSYNYLLTQSEILVKQKKGPVVYYRNRWN